MILGRYTGVSRLSAGWWKVGLLVKCCVLNSTHSDQVI